MGEERGPGYYVGTETELHYRDTHHYPLWKELLEHLPEDRQVRILDIGCGPGQMAHMLHDSGYENYFGVDFSSVVIDRAKERVPDYEFLCQDAFTIGRYSGCDHYDIVIFSEVLEHVNLDHTLLDKVDDEKRIIISLPDFSDDAHVRHFKSVEEVRNRYRHLLADDAKFSRFKMWWFIIDGKKQRHRLTITGASMVKDEGMGLRKTIPIVQKFVDHIFIVIDSATTDETVDVIHEFPDIRYIYADWIDFGANRSLSVAAAGATFPDTDWIFIFDGHEEFVGDPDELRECLSLVPDKSDSVSIPLIRQSIRNKEGAREIFQVRFLRPHIRYEGAVHHYPIQKGRVDYSGLEVVHHDEWRSEECISFRREQNQNWSIEKMVELAESGEQRYIYHLCLGLFDNGRYNDVIDWANKYNGGFFA